MVRRRSTLPLGIDVGAKLTRVALLERDAGDTPRLVACASRETAGDASAAIAAATAELGTGERRCVLGLAIPDAALLAVTFPTMPRRDRARAARFEVARSIAYPIDDASIRLVALGDGAFAIGAARRSSLAAAIEAARGARLRPIAVDDAAFALLRAFPDAEAIVDCGETATRVVVPGSDVPRCRSIALGGHSLTAAIASSLGLDEPAAEWRKRTLGLGGAGERVRDALVAQLAAILTEVRSATARDVRNAVMVGNAARLPGLLECVERALAIPVRLGVLPSGASRTLPADVLRAASPDWALAFGLALWADCA